MALAHRTIHLLLITLGVVVSGFSYFEHGINFGMLVLLLSIVIYPFVYRLLDALVTSNPG